MIKNTKEYLLAQRAILKSKDELNKSIQSDIQSFESKKLKNRKGDWMSTYSGGMFWLLDPRPEEVEITDVAHALSMLCRYNGHISGFYSVAQHCVLVSEHCNPKFALYGLLHDTAEAYTGDIISPLKKLLPNYKVIENKILKAICSKYGVRLTQQCKQEVKHWDNVLLATEVRDLIPHKYLNWKMEAEPLESSVHPLWTPEVAEQRFLARFNKLYATEQN